MSKPKGKKNLHGLKMTSTKKEIVKTKKAKGCVIELDEGTKLARQVEGWLEAKRKIEEGEADRSRYESAIRDAGHTHFIQNYIETQKRESVKFITPDNQVVQFIPMDKYVEKYFEDERELAAFKRDLGRLVKGDLDEVLSEETLFKINPDALENDKVLKELEAFVATVKKRHKVDLVHYTEKVQINKGFVDNLRSYTRLPGKMRKLMDLGGVITMLKRGKGE